MMTSGAIGQQFTFFVMAGLLTTAVDFTIYNLLTRPPVRWGRIRANCVSVTAAICFSFTVNLLFVFRPHGADLVHRIGAFLVVTASSAYVLQNLVIYLASHVWLAPVKTALWLANRIPFTKSWEEDFTKKNMVKFLAVTVGLIWNFLWYRYWVFND